LNISVEDGSGAGQDGDVIAPDTKDWTWVLQRPCPECGFDTREVATGTVPAYIRGLGSAWVTVLTEGAPDAVSARPTEERWSTLEYGCHVRDVFLLFDKRLHWMLDRDNPTFPNWDQDATAVEERYQDQRAARVAVELGAAARTLADSFGAVPPGSWSRTGARSDGARFTVATFARYLVHDPVHHLYDVGHPYDVGAPYRS
jgi:hypothetical protein